MRDAEPLARTEHMFLILDHKIQLESAFELEFCGFLIMNHGGFLKDNSI